jgi:PilZ domain
MGTTANADRRDPTAPRRAIRATVDLTPGDERDVWQADAIDLSLGGMSMRASMLPEIGEQLALAFKPEGNSTLAARGEVVWALDKGPNAGAFGVRFTDVTPAVEQSLRRMLDTKDDVITPEIKLPAEDSRVKLFIHGMDAPLRARVRATAQGELIVGSDLSFLKLGDKVDVDGGGTKVTGVIDSVDVEVDAKTRVPRLVLSIDLGGKKKKAELGTAPTVLAASPRVSEPEVATRPVARESAKPAKTAVLDDAPIELAKKPERAAKPRITQAPAALVSDAPSAEISTNESEVSFNDEAAPGWLTQGMRSVRVAAARMGDSAGPVMRRAYDAALGLKERIANRNEAVSSDAGEETSSRKGLRPQHPEASDGGDAIVTSPGKRNRKVGLYAVVGLVLAAGIVAYASSSGPKVETPHPQVAVAPETPADPNAPAADPNAAGEPVAAADPSMQNEPAGEPTAAQPEPRWVGGSNPRNADLAAAAGSPNAQGEGEMPIVQSAPPPRGARFLPPALARQTAGVQPAMVRATQPAPRFAAQPRFAPQPAQPRVMAAPQRFAAQPVSVAQAPARPAVFGNPAVRTGTVLRLHMDGPVAAIQGVGARGAQIVLSVPGRRSLDMAAPFVSQDTRIAGAGVLNGAAGAMLTLRFREAAPPFVARSRGNMLEIVLAPTPGSAPMRAGVRPALVVGQRAVR